MFRSLGVLAAFLAFPFVCYRCITAGGPAIQSTLQSTVAEAEAAASITGVTVAADGREIVLTGVVASEEQRQRARIVAMALPGVRTVENRLTVAPATPPPAPAPPVSSASSPTAASAPSAQAAAAQEQINTILIDRRIEFESGKDVLLSRSIPILEEVEGVLEQAPQLSITIEGHTDNVGDAAMNRSLSEARAQAVVRWLRDRGIAANRMQAAGRGPDQPIAPNTTAAGRARNRRVAITTR